MDTLTALPTVDLITAGWECRGHFKAGQGKGLCDHWSALIHNLVRVITLCQAHNNPDVGYLLENVNSSDDTSVARLFGALSPAQRRLAVRD